MVKFEIFASYLISNINIKNVHKPNFGKCQYSIGYHEYYNNGKTILLIDKRNLLNFNGCILKGT